eukprot:scaffold31338_cov61-Phaeocystis_antarctica.AAC.1
MVSCATDSTSWISSVLRGSVLRGSVLSFWLSHLVATVLASATERCGNSGRTPSPGGGAWGWVGEEHRARRARRWHRSPILLAYTSSPPSRLGRALVESCTGSMDGVPEASNQRSCFRPTQRDSPENLQPGAPLHARGG